jgi:hypothetical protein
MKLKSRIAAIASVAALGTAGSLILAVSPASASQTGYICWYTEGITDQGYNNNPVFVNGDCTQAGSATEFSDVNHAMWGSRNVYEWEVPTTGYCLQRSPSTGRVVLAKCSPGATDELWWQNGGNFALESDGDCMYPNFKTSGPEVWLEACGVSTDEWAIYPS